MHLENIEMGRREPLNCAIQLNTHGRNLPFSIPPLVDSITLHFSIPSLQSYYLMVNH
jgi:hypothetical protein